MRPMGIGTVTCTPAGVYSFTQPFVDSSMLASHGQRADSKANRADDDQQPNKNNPVTHCDSPFER
jgi:hypothetical protein